MVNYKNGKIYKIVSDITDDIYIGSTTVGLSMRMAGHRVKYKRWKNGKYNFVSSFEILKHGDAQIVLIESVECKTKEELHQAERKWIKTMECVNKVIPCRTKKEWREDNKAELLAKKKQYREKNKAKIKQKFNCPCGGRYTYGSKARHFKTQKHKNWFQASV